MFYAFDKYEINYLPKRNYSMQWSIFFLIHFFIGNLMVLNAFIGVIIEKVIDVKTFLSKNFKIKIFKKLLIYLFIYLYIILFNLIYLKIKLIKFFFFKGPYKGMNSDEKEWAILKGNILKAKPQKKVFYFI